MNKERLLNVARALRESPAPEGFTMAKYAHECGTPACALGHYAARRDLQGILYIDEHGDMRDTVSGEEACYDDEFILEHFEFKGPKEANLFFSAYGCDGAKTALHAALFIEVACK